jgi:hypothetical protein
VRQEKVRIKFPRKKNPPNMPTPIGDKVEKPFFGAPPVNTKRPALPMMLALSLASPCHGTLCEVSADCPDSRTVAHRLDVA